MRPEDPEDNARARPRGAGLLSRRARRSESGEHLVRRGAWVKRLLLCSALAVVVYLVALSSGSGWLYVLAAAVMGTAVLSLVGIRADAPGIETLVQEGSDIPALIELENRSRLPRYVLECRLWLAGGSGGEVMGRLGGLGSASLSRPRTHSLEVSVRRVRRGVYERGSVEVGSGVPFGLFHVLRRFPVAANVTVYPELVDARGLLDALDASAVSGRAYEAGRETRQKEPGMGEMRGLREYRAGDPARLVSWRASARALASGETPRIVELEEEAGEPRPLSIRVDLGEGADPEEAEATLSTATSLFVAAIERGRVVYGYSTANADLEGSRELAVALAWCAALEHPGTTASASPGNQTQAHHSGRPGHDTSPDVSLCPRSAEPAGPESPATPIISLEVVGPRPSRAPGESGAADGRAVERKPAYGQPQPPRAFYPASGRIQRS